MRHSGSGPRWLASVSRDHQHPWLHVELAIRAIIADRLTRGSSPRVDRVLMARVEDRERIERAGWFN